MADQNQTMTARRRLSVAALLLLTLGIVLLLNTTGAVGWGIWWQLFRFWPLILIAVGLNIILSPRFPLVSALVVALILAVGVGAAYLSSEDTAYDDLRMSSYSVPANGADTLELDIDFGAGSLVIDSLASPDEDTLLAANFNDSGADVRESRSGNVAEVTLEGWDFDIDLFGLFRSLGDLNWNVRISPATAVRLDIEGGAADMDLLLADLNVKIVDIDVGAADVDITLPAAGHTNVDVDAGAADIDIVVPDGVAAWIRLDSALSSIDVDATRFPKIGDDWKSADYDTSRNRVEINIDAGASDISIN